MGSIAQQNQPTAGVIGAGIAGLSAAIGLRRAGWHVEIFERSRMKNEVGAALCVMPVGVAVLDDWGFDFEKAEPIENQRMTVLNATSLDVIAHETFADIKQQYGHAALTFHRVDLHHGLRDLATGPEGEHHSWGQPASLHCGNAVITIDCDRGTLELASGEVMKKDLLIIADGAHSDLYSQFTGEPDPIKRIGKSLYRILLNHAEVLSNPNTAHLLTSYPTAHKGFFSALDPVDGAYTITYPCRSQSPVLNVAIVHNTKPSPEASSNERAEKSWQSPASIAEVLGTIHNYHPDFKALISLGKDDDDIKIHHAMRRPPLKSFASGRALVIGDAAHLMMPTHAAGASMAIESAGVLEVLMRDVTADSPAEVIQERLKIFDRLRVPRCTAFQILSNEGWMSQAQPEVVAQIREQGFHGWLPGPDAGPWSAEFRKWYFNHDARAEAKQALRILKDEE